MLPPKRVILENQASVAKGEFENHLKDGETDSSSSEGSPLEVVTKRLQGLLQGWRASQCTAGRGHLILESVARELKVMH